MPRPISATQRTIVSTPEYAMAKIEETPMQDPTTGAFVPQSKDYLASVPGPDLCDAFERILTRRGGMLGEDPLGGLPPAAFLDAQRWGSAMPCHPRAKHDGDSPTRRILAGVAYDSGRFPLAPTRDAGRAEDDGGGAHRSFLADEDLMLFQAGDMVSCHSPGLEGAALSGYDAAEFLYGKLFPS